MTGFDERVRADRGRARDAQEPGVRGHAQSGPADHQEDERASAPGRELRGRPPPALRGERAHHRHHQPTAQQLHGGGLHGGGRSLPIARDERTHRPGERTEHQGEPVACAASRQRGSTGQHGHPGRSEEEPGDDQGRWSAVFLRTESSSDQPEGDGWSLGARSRPSSPAAPTVAITE